MDPLLAGAGRSGPLLRIVGGQHEGLELHPDVGGSDGRAARLGGEQRGGVRVAGGGPTGGRFSAPGQPAAPSRTWPSAYGLRASGETLTSISFECRHAAPNRAIIFGASPKLVHLT